MIKARFTTNTWRLTFLIQGSPHNILSDIILLGQVEELADLAGPFGAEAAGDSAVGQPRDVLLAWGRLEKDKLVNSVIQE